MRKTHGLSLDESGKKNKLYQVWENMKARCYNTKLKCYPAYGGRGIAVCEEWRNNYFNFYKWAIENGYQVGLTLDREKVNEDYSPNNCRWVTWATQSINRRDTHMISYNGITKCLTHWADDLGISPRSLRKRLAKWPEKRALSEPKNLTRF